MGVCYIVGAGSFYGLHTRPGPGDLVIAADGGYAYCQEAGVTPDRIVEQNDAANTADNKTN